VYSKSPKNTQVTSDLVVKEFKKKFPKEANNLEDIFGVDSDYDEGRLLTMDYYRKIGLKSLPIVILNGYLLKENELEDDAFEESVITKVMQFTSDIQMSVYKGIINDRTVLLDWLMNKDTIMPRLNPRVLATPSNRVYLDETKHLAKHSADITNDLKYYLLNENEKVHALTLWVVCDPDTAMGREFLYEAINFYESSKIGARLALILNGDSETMKDDENNLIKRAIFFALNTFENDKTKVTNFIKKLLREKTFDEIKNKKLPISELDFITKVILK
jgi:UDP-glucose:glycoprotein glucosyltransferase